MYFFYSFLLTIYTRIIRYLSCISLKYKKRRYLTFYIKENEFYILYLLSFKKFEFFFKSETYLTFLHLKRTDFIYIYIYIFYTYLII